MKPYDILFFKSNNLMGKLISFFSRSKYCHVGILMPDGKSIFDINIGKRSSTVSISNLKDVEVYRVNGVVYTEDVECWVMDHTNLKYDIGEIIKYIFGVNTPDDDNKFICSSLVLDFIGECTNVKIPDNVYVVSPQDLIDLELVIKI